MIRRIQPLLFCLFLLGLLAQGACNTAQVVNGTGSGNNTTGNTGSGGSGGGTGASSNIVVFNPVGGTIGNNLLDLEFLPGQNGESLVISQDGNVYYLKSDFTPVGSPVNIPVTYNGDERGLLNVAADPLYNTNHYVYFYYTVKGSSPDVNRVERYDVNVDTGAGTFSLENPHTIIEFAKTTSAANHNGGGMVFMSQDDLALGVGDGFDTPNFAQDTDERLGKIHRIIPDRTPGPATGEHFSIPADQDVGQAHNASTTIPSIFSLGVRNPFTIVVDEDGDLFFGDVGFNTFEELNCAYVVSAPENYGWPICEGPCNPSNINLRDPTWGYRHGDSTFDDQDPAVNPDFGEAIMMNAFYQGSQYNGMLTDRHIYSDFYHGWVRLLTVNAFDIVTSDQHLGHLEGLVSLHENPADGFLYGVSLFGSDNVQRDHVLKMELAP
jgi:glucose/arabinose dehydrogenase